MNKIIARPDVEKAIADLKANGKKATYIAIHAAMGNRGSMSTLAEIMKELAMDSQPFNDSKEELKSFREIWAVAREEGRRLQESVIADLQENIKAFAAENERLEGMAVAAANRAESDMQAKREVVAALEKANSRLAESQAALIRSSQDTQAALKTLGDEQTAHQRTQQELQAAIQKAHELELELMRTRTLLEAKSSRDKKQGPGKKDGKLKTE